MEVSTLTISACIAKSLIVRQLQQNDELVAVEDSIDVGNVLYILYYSLWPNMWTPTYIWKKRQQLL